MTSRVFGYEGLGQRTHPRTTAGELEQMRAVLADRVFGVAGACRPSISSLRWIWTVWQRSLERLFRWAQVPNRPAHRFHDTFAVEVLLAEVPLGRVSVLAGSPVCCPGQLFTTTTPTPPWQGGELNHHSPPLLRRGRGGGGCRCQPGLMVNSKAGRHTRTWRSARNTTRLGSRPASPAKGGCAARVAAGPHHLSEG